MTRPRILGLDPALCATGWAVGELAGSLELLEVGAIRTAPSPKKRGLLKAHDDARRIDELARGVLDLVARHRPKLLVVELPHGGAKSSRAARALGIATGLAATLAAACRLPVEWVQPDELKRQLCGSRAAGKAAVQAAVLERWPAVDWPRTKAELEHAADAAAALAVAADSPASRVGALRCA